MPLESGQPIHDAAYAKAWRDVAGNIVADRLIAGQNWPQIWTRDSAYALDLGSGLGRPDIAKATMRAKTTMIGLGEVWSQDRAGHFGQWPHLTDSIVGAVGVWAAYLADGDRDLLAWGLQVTRNTLTRAENDVYDSESGLFRGCSSFMESNSGYPWRYRFDGRAIGRTKALSTNVLYYRGYVLAARMAALLGEDPGDLGDRAARLSDAINRRLWVPDRGLYAYYEHADGHLSGRMEGLGESLAILWGVAEDGQANAILKNVVSTAHGIPCLWPRYLAWLFRINDANFYHNGMVWPFVQAYWALAAAKYGATEIFGRELAHLATSAARTTTFHEFYRPFSGRPDGSPRQLWSAAGYLAMVHCGLFGIAIDADRVRLAPIVPEGFGPIRLSGWRTRDMVLDIEVSGPGNEVADFRLDGQSQPDHMVPIDLTGRHAIEITLRRR